MYAFVGLVYLVGGIADVDDHESDVLVLETSFFIEVKDLEQKFQFLFILYPWEDYYAWKYLDGIYFSSFFGVPEGEERVIGPKDLNVLGYIDGKVLTDGLVRRIVLNQFGISAVEKSSIDFYLFPLDVSYKASHIYIIKLY